MPESRKIMPGRLIFIFKIFFVLFLLFLFLNAVNLMGLAFKLLGKNWMEAIFTTTSNPVVGLCLGILATTLVQSSSVTTSMVVGLVSAGAMGLSGAVPVIMGANVGTTVTNTVVSLGHIRRGEEFRRAFAGATVHDFFNLMAVGIFLPLELATGMLETLAQKLSDLFYGSQGVSFKSPLKVILKPLGSTLQSLFRDFLGFSDQTTGIFLLVLALGLIFLCLFWIVRIMRGLMLDKIERAMGRFFELSGLMTISIGMIMTFLVQSSSITTSLFIPLVGAGLISVTNVFPLTLGANLGTTMTALLAALAGTQAGLTIAFVHLLFNLLGTLLVYPLEPIRRLPVWMAEKTSSWVVNHRKMAIVYILVLFYGLPLAVIIISRA